MTKELTDQWRKGNIQETYYYTKSPWSEGEVDISYVHNGVDDWTEIVAPVLSYTELCELKQDLEICKDDKADLYAKLCNALMQLEEYKQKVHILNEANIKLENTIGKFGEQLEEANNVIRFYANADGLTEEEKQMTAEKYHLVYGLKACDYLERSGVK